VPGNHDIPLFNLAQRLLRPHARYQRAFGRPLEPELDHPAVLVLAVDTTRWWRHADGEVSPAQVDRVVRRLAQASARQWKLLLLHHPLAVARAQDRHNLLHGHAHAVQRWRAAGADMVLGGHIHLPYVLPLAGPALGTVPGPVLWVVQAGTAISSRVRPEAGNSVNLIRLADSGPRRAVVERWDLDAATQQFTCVAQQALAGPASG
jgi:3',5'-cyclic AMP phosphodiesterase CpdA